MITRFEAILLSLIPYGSYPDWESVAGYYSTGLFVWDVDGNGLNDLVVSNGNDMQRQRNHIHYNLTGIPERNFSTFSSYENYSGHIYMGDVDGDGVADLSVANFSGYPEGWNLQRNFIFKGNGTSFTSVPIWSSPDPSMCFSTYLADLDGDGVSEAMFACGNTYANFQASSKAYDILENVQIWSSPEGYSYGILALDYDNDGDLDIVLGRSGGGIELYENFGDSISSSPVWVSSDTCDANQLTAGDVDGNGYVDLVVSNTFQFQSGRSNISLYLNTPSGFQSVPSWKFVQPQGYFSTVFLADVDGDDDLDLVAGGWFNRLYIFLNEGGYLTSEPVWSSSITLVAERIFLSDLDNASLKLLRDTFVVSKGGVFKLEKQPISYVNAVYVNAKRINSFVYSNEHAWISIDTSLLVQGDTVIVEYAYAEAMDIVVSNWEPNRGNYIFLHGSVHEQERSVSIREGEYVRIYDLSGKLVYKGKYRRDLKLPRKVLILETDRGTMKLIP